MKEATNKSCHSMFVKVRRSMPKVQIIDTTQEYIQEYELKAKWDWLQFLFREKRKGYHGTVPRVQIGEPVANKDTEQGEVNQSSVKNENTIITRDQCETVSDPSRPLDSVSTETSSEPKHKFKSLTGRWMPLAEDTMTVNDDQGKLIKSYYLPELLYGLECAPNLTPFESFIYGRMNMELRVVVNASKFHCGKLLVSSKYDSYQSDAVQIGYQSALARNHLILDMAANNEGVLSIPFRYHRPWTRLVKNDNNSKGVRPSKYCSVYLHVLAKLQTGAGGASDVGIRTYYRFKDVEFAGMSYRVKVQALGLEDVLSVPTTRALKEVLGGAERAFDQLGRTSNQDKPGVVNGTIIIPRPRMNFCTGKGIVDVMPLRVNPHTLTNYTKIQCPSDEPKSFYELARIWGAIKIFDWSKDTASGTELGAVVIDPTLRSYTADQTGEPTPLEYACGNFMFWSGPIEVRLDFVSNAFHTGAVQLSAEFGRKTGSTNECESSSTYTKMFHLGDQKSVTFTIPYIYDTLFRRTTASVWNPYRNRVADNPSKSKALTVAPESRTFFKIRVINPLRPVASAPQTINVIMFIRAGRNFAMHGLKAFSYVPVKTITAMDNFPANNYAPTTARKTRDLEDARRRPLGGSTTTQAPSKPIPHMPIPPGQANQWNEYKPEYLSTLPKTQMDNGEKEDLDPTEDFSQGLSARFIQTLDSQVSFKDLLRRPYLLMDKVTVKPQAAGAFFIPLMPPNRDMAFLSDTDTGNNVWARTIQDTSAVAIMDMFRAWRGGMRYTVVVHKGEKPIFVSLIPHSGVRIIGNHQVIDQGSYPIYGSNFTTEMIIPLVNPTAVIEAPYDTENTWTLTFDEDSQKNYTWRDKGDYNSGHLAITVEDDTIISVFWSAADDFEIANFYGTPNCKNNGWAWRWNDEQAPTVQMDFLSEEARIPIRDLLTKKSIRRIATSMIPYVGTPMIMSEALTGVEDKVNEVVSKATDTMHRVDVLVDQSTTQMQDISHLLKTAVEQITKTCTGLISSASLLYDFLLDITMAWMEKSWRVVALGMVRFITKAFPRFMVTTWTTMLEYVEQLTTWFRGEMENETPRVQVGPSSEATLCGILAGIVGTIFGVIMDNRRQRHMVLATWERLTTASGMSYIVNMLRFVQSVFETVKNYTMECLGYISPEAQALRILGEKNGIIQHFVTEAQIITSEANTVILNQSAYRLRFWKCVMTAHQLQRIICAVPSNTVSAQLCRLCSEVIKAGNEKFIDLSASPVRFEPMVVCIEGPSGVGKSHSVETLVCEMLKTIGYQNPSTESIYYRTAGEKYWSGYRDQPVIVYDEWLNTLDTQRCTDQIAEIMKLKSTAVFIPEMAHLEEKKIRGNPLLIIMLCNNAFPTISDYARHPEATFRRREIVLRCTRTPEYEGVQLREVDPTELRDYAHLQYDIYKSPAHAQSLANEWKSYASVQRYLCTRFAKYHEREVQMVNERMARLPGLMNQQEGDLRLEDPFTLFYGLNHQIQQDIDLSQNGWTPYEQLHAAVELLSNAVNQRMIQPPRVQGLTDIASVAIGVIWDGWLPKKILKYSMVQLRSYVASLVPIKQVLSECLICREQTSCTYVCRETYENPNAPKHLMCMSCARTNGNLGNGRCPLCRCPEVIPYLNQEEIENLGVWTWMCMRGGLGLAWLCDKLIYYYQWRNDDFWGSLYVDHCISVALMILAPTVADQACQTRLLSMVGRVGTEHIRSWFPAVRVQGDEWDVECPSNTPSSSRGLLRVQDSLTPQVNDIILEECVLKSIDTQICLHHYLKADIARVQVEKNMWITSDLDTARVLRVPMVLCEKDCAFESVDSYRQFANQYLMMNLTHIRGLYIDYINQATELRLERIPWIYRPTWATPIVTGLHKSWWELLSDYYKEYKAFIWYAIGACGAAAVVIKLYSVMNTMSTQVQARGGAVYDSEVQHARTRTLLRRSGERSYFQSAVENPPVFAVVEKYIMRNTTKIVVVVKEKTTTMYGTGLFNQYMLIPRHYARFMKEAILKGARITAWPIMKPQMVVELNLTQADFIESDTTDLAYMKMPPSFEIYKDLRKFIPSDTEYDKPLPSTGVLLCNPGGGHEYMREIEVEIHGIADRQIVMDMDDQAFEVRDVVVYNYSKAGVCGSILLRENHQCPIISMHFAGIGSGTAGEGFGVILSKEMLGAICQMNVPVQVEDVDYGPIENAKFIYTEDIKLNYLGSVPPQATPYIPTKSKLVKSSIYGCVGLETIMEPTILDRSDPRYIHETTPLYEGVKHHGKLTRDFTTTQVNRARERLWDGWISKLKPLIAQPQVLTDEQAIVGLEYEYYTGMDLSTSAGYPFVCNKLKQKGDYIEVIKDAQQRNVGVKSLHPQLEQVMHHKRGLRQQGIIPQTLFVDTLKDEKRKHDKVLSIGGTRVFCNSPLDYVIECRKYFMHFIATFMKHRMSMMHGVGINPLSAEWGDLLHRLLRKNSEFVTLDYSNFGPGYNAGVAEAAYELMIRWTMRHVPHVDERILRVIVWECIQSTHIVNNTVYQQTGGSPSGAVFTTIVNTMVNILYILIAWEALTWESEITRSVADEFKDNTQLFTYGDDLIMTVTPQYLDAFNGETIVEFFKTYGIVATNAEKTKTIIRTVPLSQASFLKRGFIRHPTRQNEWLSPLAWESIVSATQWVWKGPNLKESTLINVEAALLQAHGHGPRKFEDFKILVNKYLLKARIEPLTLLWEEIDRKFFTTGLEYN